MNKNTILGFILIAAIMIGYTVWMSPSKEEKARLQRIEDSISRVKKIAERKQAELKKQLPPEEVTEKNSVPAQEQGAEAKDLGERRNKYANFANESIGRKDTITIETDLVTYKISTKSGFIIDAVLKKYQTWDSLPLQLFEPGYNNFGLAFFSQNKLVNTNELYFTPTDSSSRHFSISGDKDFQFSMRLYADDSEGKTNPNSYIEYLYNFKGDNYMFDFTINLVNMRGVIPANINTMELNWFSDLIQQERSIDRFNGSTVYYKFYHDDVDYLSETKDEEKQINTRLRWVSFKQRFFSSTLIAKEYFGGGNIKTYELKDKPYPKYLKTMSASLDVPINPSGNTSIPLSMYMGPNKFKTLRSYHLELERQIPIGWSLFILAWINEYIIIPVFDWLGGYGWNYGIVILVLTIMLKTVLFPIAYKTYMSSAKMRVLKPEVEEINKKFPKKEDAMKKQKAVMGLYKKAGANPASGCVPMLLQMPILFAMFRFFPSSIELRQQSFLWAHDLSSYDSILDLPFKIPFYGDHVSLFTLLMTISTVMYTYLNNQMMGQQTTQMPGMKTMMYIMPVMFLGIFNNYASGLSYYYFLANIITFGQMFVFRYLVNEDKLRAQIEANKKKPRKTSNFQKRLEEAAKKRGR
ncbi:MAG TPA: membrane protein insertase YidC [Bacteroidetes bacterium]|nr:membrane protein insertase YidC [Bacteroidota bacterium]